MDTISSYLEHMFATLPRSGQMLRLKQEMLSTMEEKYNELKLEGKSENEAVGIVISEFGNIEELATELGLSPLSAEPVPPLVTDEDAFDYMAAARRTGMFTGIGVFLCLTGAALLILLSQLGGDGYLGSRFSEGGGSMLGLMALILLLVPAIGLFIYSNTKLERFEHLQEDFILTSSMRTMVEQSQARFAPTYTLSLIAGVSTIILSTLAIFAPMVIFGDNASTYGVAGMLPLVGGAVFVFIYYGRIRESHQVLLQTGEHSKSKKAENKVIGAVAAIVWPLATCLFLLTGFVFDMWHINWVIFPVTGILFGVFSAVFNIVKGSSVQS